ncbi:MAG: 3-deoxy-D-manno-octulosonic acid transferase [Bacteroides sp.]|nr:hypothetical protein [Roseburia sp.]MCM1345823.1 3-deoxy-D-manno-octulosonic acid transferase [Bacteroides sp.]MCM1421288.1 3-deoxy-D-manno-octulosonic acid transferase [Bacteroides sp.]
MAHLLYNTALAILENLICLAHSKTVSGIFRRIFSPKTIQFIESHPTDHIQKISHLLANETRDIYWVHAASLGEYAVARPLLKELRQSGNKCVVLTFFSPTGYYALKGKPASVTDADYILTLPIDTRHNAKAFVDALSPRSVIFIISEYWANYLHELSSRKIPVTLVSAIISERSVFFKWYGAMHRRTLRCFTSFTVLDKKSHDNLVKLGISRTHAIVTGDPLFDNAISTAKTTYHDQIIESFCGKGAKTFVAGSISDKKDLGMVSYIANKHRDTRFIIVPHEISEETLNDIKYHLEGHAMLYSECTHTTDFSQVQVLIIDFIGSLSRIYRYGQWAYVGGGFTPFLHSVIEPVVYGIPVAFGPRIHRKVTPRQMADIGIGCMVRSRQELDDWFSQLKHNEPMLADIRQKATDYAGRNAGATRQVISVITNQDIPF